MIEVIGDECAVISRDHPHVRIGFRSHVQDVYARACMCMRMAAARSRAYLEVEMQDGLGVDRGHTARDAAEQRHGGLSRDGISLG